MTAATNQQKLQHAVKCHQSGQTDDAARIYREVLLDEPLNADAWHLNGLIQYAAGDVLNAEASIRRAVELKPEETEFRANLAAVLVNQLRSEEAENVCRHVLSRSPGHPGALSHLGTALRQQHRLLEALQAFQGVGPEKQDAALLCNLGTVLSDLGRIDDAHNTFLKARELGPNMPQVHVNLGAVQRELGQFDDALQSLSTAERLRPDSYEVRVNRGNLFLECGRVCDAIEEFQSAIALNSSLPAAVSGLARALQQAGCWEESLEAHRLAAELAPGDRKLESAYLYSVTLSPLLSRDEVFHRHAEWGRTLESAIAPVQRYRNSRIAERPLRIGYVSPDFRSHATMRFAYPFLVAHDRDAVEVYLYSETTREDDVTKNVASIADGWCATRGMSDSSLAERISRDQIDVLVDLAGHTAENRLSVFAARPAPVQATFLGYPTTTGLTRIDYFLTDSIREPQETKRYFTEQPFMMPHGACCYQATEAPDVNELPLLRNGYITFGSMHRPEKISPQALKVWAHVLTSIPDARLLMFRDTFSSSAVREQIRQRLLESGINTARVDFGWELPDSHLEIYHQVDILLDVFPWGSGTVAYDAMWMGVPVPTLLGDRGGCRATASMLHFCGCSDLIARDTNQYIETTRRLAGEPSRLANLRSGIRSSMSSTVCNGKQFARDLETAYRQMWQRWLTGSRSNSGGS